jgi:hypothetical protein
MNKWHKIDGVLVMEVAYRGSAQIKRLHSGTGKAVWRYEVFEHGECIDHGTIHSLAMAKRTAERRLLEALASV